MKKIWIPVFLAAAAAAASAGENREPDIVVVLHYGPDPAASLGLAKRQAAQMLASAGISVEWPPDRLNYHGSAEVIEAVLMEQPNPQFRPGALAFAHLGPQFTTRIEIFYNRVRDYSRVTAVPAILAHVLVHEITHILEDVNRHSESGVMKAHWDMKDFLHMRYASLPFAEEDIRLIHAWAARHRQTLVAGLR